MLCALALAYAVLASAAGVNVTTTTFNRPPSQVSYFEDSSVVLALFNDGTVSRSEDEGKTWAPVSAVRNSAYLLILHPHNSRLAYILTNDKEHFFTLNRGAMWQRFHTPDPPAVRAGMPLDFHADPQLHDHILYMGRRCTAWNPWSGSVCHDIAYYTVDAFASGVKPLMTTALDCSWAKATPEVRVPDAHMQRIFCIGWDDDVHQKRTPLDDERYVLHSSAEKNLRSLDTGRTRRVPASAPKSRLFASDDFFKTRTAVDMGVGRNARAFRGLGASHGFLIAALENPARGRGTEMSLFISTDGVTWKQAQFPHGQSLHESAYTVLDGPKSSLLVDVYDAASGVGTLFASDAEGTRFVQKLSGTQRNANGVVDYEHLANIEGAAIANVKSSGVKTSVTTKITHNEGNTWEGLFVPAYGAEQRCPSDASKSCSLHLHAVTDARNIGRTFSSTAPGIVMGVGNFGTALEAYDDCDTFISRDAGLTWIKVAAGPHMYQFGDQGALLVMLPTRGPANSVQYSFDFGDSWEKLYLPQTIMPFALTTIPDATALKFMLFGPVPRSSKYSQFFLDFATLGKRKCSPSDFEKWYPETSSHNCFMGHRQWYKRRKLHADCVVGEKFHDPESQEDACTCTDSDYECDFGYMRAPSGRCELRAPEPIPEGACLHEGDTYLGSSGYRRIPGNTCRPDGEGKDARVRKPCRGALPDPGQIAHRSYTFPAPLADIHHFPSSAHVVVRLADGQVFQSANDGSTWNSLRMHIGEFANDRALMLLANPDDTDCLYIITGTQRVYYTLDEGVSWKLFTAPLPANRLSITPLSFSRQSPTSLIWIGSRGCENDRVAFVDCRVEAFVSQNRGLHWDVVDRYVRRCEFTPDGHSTLCESHRDKHGSQLDFNYDTNPLQLVRRDGSRAKVIFGSILSFSSFGPYILVAELEGNPPVLRMRSSVDAVNFPAMRLPNNIKLDNRAYTVVNTSTAAVFMHVTTHAAPRTEWGPILRSNSNGTYFSLSLENANRNEVGYVDFESMGLYGIALANVVANTDDAAISSYKLLQTRITHNDGGFWSALTPPAHDRDGKAYGCDEVGCALHLHGVTERPDTRITTSSPNAQAFMIGVGNVGRFLLPYRDSDTFFSRDAGFTWTEIHKDAHKWEFGDSGSLIVLVNDEQPTDTVLYSLDQGASWKSYNFGERIRLRTIDTVPEDTRRKFVLFGQTTGGQARDLAVFLDFSELTRHACVFDEHDDQRNDFEKWSPSQQRSEACIFGRQVWIWRRKQDRDCVVGNTLPQARFETQCACTERDFECDFNYQRDANSQDCVLVPGAQPPSNDDEPRRQCWENDVDYDGYWYERTNKRKVFSSACRGGVRPDRGARHKCPPPPRTKGAHGFVWWLGAIGLGAGALYGALYWWKSHGERLYGEHLRVGSGISPLVEDVLEQLALAISFAKGLAGIAWARTVDFVASLPIARDWMRRRSRPFTNYHVLSTEEDAEVRTVALNLY